MAYIIGKEGRTIGISAVIAIYPMFYLAYLGLSWSKEINIASMLWILIFYYGLLLRGVNWGKIIGGVPLIIIFIYTVDKIYIASHNSYYGVAPVTPDLLINNAALAYSGNYFRLRRLLFITIAFCRLSGLPDFLDTAEIDQQGHNRRASVCNFPDGPVCKPLSDNSALHGRRCSATGIF